MLSKSNLKEIKFKPVSLGKKEKGDRKLSKLDVQLSQTYSSARSKAADKDKLKSEQIAWVKTSRACQDTACLTKAFQDRIKQLSN